MRVGIRVLVADQKHWHPDKRVHKYWLDVRNKSGKVSWMEYVPDTGAMMTRAGPALLNNLNMAPDWTETEGKKSYTRQFCYTCKEVTGLNLSLSACEDLDGMLPWNKDNSPLVVNGIKQEEDRRSSYRGTPGRFLLLPQEGTKRRRLNVISLFGPNHPHCQIRCQSMLGRWISYSNGCF